MVQTFASLIHEQARAGIMVTHDTRMTAYADRVIQMMDGKIERIIGDPNEIDLLSRGGLTMPLGARPAARAGPALAGDG